jgi:hypothetical protein
MKGRCKGERYVDSSYGENSVDMEQSFGNKEGKIGSRVMPAQGQSFSRIEI